MISDLDRLKETFHAMSADGFNVDGNLRWGFYFLDNSKEKLLKVYDELKDHGYELHDITEIDSDEWRLSVSKVDTLTAEKLHRRNVAFNELADYCSVECYDGWDVEKL